MAFKKTLVQRLFNLSRFSTPNVSRNPGGSSKPPLMQSDPARTAMAPDPGETTRIKRVVQRRPLYQSAMTTSSPSSMRLFPPVAGEKLVEKLRGMDIARDKIRLGGLLPFPTESAREESNDDDNKRKEAREEYADGGLTASDVRKVLRASQVEMIRGKLREIPNDWISYSEFVNVCKESCGGNRDQALSFAKTLDDSGSVIVLGNAVCLRPHQEIKILVTKAIEKIVSPTLSDPNDPRKKELEQLEQQKAAIDRRADTLVRRELWAGLGYLMVQTAAFMRLTFWELSWDVMEPICFYVTSGYFMAGYAFFLRTSKEPSFEGFFQSRFSSKQKRLMKAQNFDLQRYNQLRKVCYPNYSTRTSSSSSHSDDVEMIKFGDHHTSD